MRIRAHFSHWANRTKCTKMMLLHGQPLVKFMGNIYHFLVGPSSEYMGVQKGPTSVSHCNSTLCTTYQLNYRKTLNTAPGKHGQSFGTLSLSFDHASSWTSNFSASISSCTLPPWEALGIHGTVSQQHQEMLVPIFQCPSFI